MIHMIGLIGRYQSNEAFLESESNKAVDNFSQILIPSSFQLFWLQNPGFYII